MIRSYLVFLVIAAWSFQAAAITGGQPATAERAPWTAALIDTSIPVEDQCLDSGGSEAFCQQYCAGVVIAPDWVLTAAHCLVERDVENNVRVILGEPDLNDDAQKRHEVHEPVLLPDGAPTTRNSVTFDKDIGLLRLKQPTEVPPASLARPALLNDLESRADTLNDPVTIYGWGRLHDNGAFPAHLHQVAFDLRPPALYTDCSENTFFEKDWMICASETEPETIEPNDSGDNTPRDPYGEGSCEKDSGGPMVSHRNGQAFVTGLASWGLSSNCGDPAAPDVYTRVPYFLEFIEQQTLNNTGSVLINPAIEIDAVNSTDSTSTGVTVTLRNDSVQNTVPDPEFTLSWTGTGDVSHDTSGSGLSCSPGSETNTHVCQHDVDLSAGGSASATFTAANLQADTTLDLQARANWSSGNDYQSATSRDSHRIARTGHPDLRLELKGAVPERLQDGGRLHLFATVSNASDHVDASGVKLAIAPPSDHILADSGGLNCNGTLPVECEIIDTLAAGESVTLDPIRLDSPGPRDGELDLSLTARNGDFPDTGTNGKPDAEVSRAVTYPARQTTGAAGSGSSGGGALWASSLLILLFAGIRIVSVFVRNQGQPGR